LAGLYVARFGVDVREMRGSGAAGGLAGGLAAIGAKLVPGFDLVSDAVALAERMEGADLVVTGEGHMDEQSFAGKVVGGVSRLAADAGVPVLVVAGDADDDVRGQHVSLAKRYGIQRATTDAAECLRTTVREHLAGVGR
jgi:glycerate kinase